MPNIQPAIDTFMADITLMEKGFDQDIRKMIKRMQGMSETELINTINQANFFQEMVDAGYGEALDKLDDEYTRVLQAAIKEARKRGIEPLTGASIEGLETLRDLDYKRLLGRAEAHADDLRSILFRGVYGGNSIQSISAALESTTLASHQLNVVAYDGLKIFDDTTRFKVFEGQDVRWTYIGPQDERTRDACKQTKADAPKNGYKEKDIPSDTPIGIRGGFNCRHSWMVR